MATEVLYMGQDPPQPDLRRPVRHNSHQSQPDTVTGAQDTDTGAQEAFLAENFHQAPESNI